MLHFEEKLRPKEKWLDALKDHWIVLAGSAVGAVCTTLMLVFRGEKAPYENPVIAGLLLAAIGTPSVALLVAQFTRCYFYPARHPEWVFWMALEEVVNNRVVTREVVGTSREPLLLNPTAGWRSAFGLQKTMEITFETSPDYHTWSSPKLFHKEKLDRFHIQVEFKELDLATAQAFWRWWKKVYVPPVTHPERFTEGLRAALHATNVEYGTFFRIHLLEEPPFTALVDA